MNLALKYRPHTFSEVVGQKAICAVLQAMLRKGILDKALLFTGPSGVGKTTMARIIAAELNSQGATDVHEGLHPSVLEIDAASNGSVAALRQLKHDLNFTSYGHRVVILDEAHAISDEGKAVLLNMLEFTPENVTFILITTEAHRIPKEVRHRCDSYLFKRPTVEEIVTRLEQVCLLEGISIENTLLRLIAQRSEGSFRESLVVLKQVVATEICSVDQFRMLYGEQDYGPILLKSALSGAVHSAKALESVLYVLPAEEIIKNLTEALKDLMIIKSGQPIDVVGEALEIRQEIANRLDAGRILKCIRIMWDLQTKLTRADIELGLYMAYALIADTVGQEAPAAVPARSGPMSFADMQRKIS